MVIIESMNRSAIDALHGRLLELHKTLLEGARADFERENGPIPHAGAFLQLLVSHDDFAWLRPLTSLLVEIDDPKLTPDMASAQVKVDRLFAENPRYVT